MTEIERALAWARAHLHHDQCVAVQNGWACAYCAYKRGEVSDRGPMTSVGVLPSGVELIAHEGCLAQTLTR